LERERVTVQEAARQLGITESAVRKRAARGQIRSVKVTEGKRERLYIFVDKDQDQVPEPFRERYLKSMEDRVRTLEDEVYRQQAIILSMSQSLQALTGGTESPETFEQAPKAATPHSDTPSEAQEDTEPPQDRTHRLQQELLEARRLLEDQRSRSWWRRMFWR
jgi:excisionase family DNA binding protein